MINWLENWFVNHCDGSWEYSYGIKMETLDNPGWIVIIDTFGTELYDRPFAVIDKDESENNWMLCKIKDDQFAGFGDPQKLGNILTIFQEWNDEQFTKENDEMINWLENWFASHCRDCFYDDYYGMKIHTLSNAGWSVQIDVIETELENKKFTEVKNIINPNDRVECKVEHGMFKGEGDAKKLMTILNIFRKWTEI